MRGVPIARIVALVALVALSACGAHPGTGDVTGKGAASNGKIRVVTTFSTLNSFVEAVGGERVTVQNLVPIGASPEDYQPAPQDIATLSRAQLVVQNGLGIEVWLASTIKNAANSHVRVLVLSDGLPHVGNNPHLWMDPTLAQRYVDKIRDALTDLDPAGKRTYAQNAARYKAELASLARSIQRQIGTIPPSQRAMIVFHNAFDYYNRRFGIRTVGVIELSPGQDPNPPYVAHLVDLARHNHVRAVFSEPEYSPKLAQTLARSAGISVVTDLYDDSVGNDARVRDYVHMLQYDTNVIVKALR